MNKKIKYQRILTMILTTTIVSLLFLCGCSSSKEEKDESFDTITLNGDFKDAGFVQSDVNSDTILWMCSAYAIYTECNNKELGIVGGILPEDKEVTAHAVKEVLSVGWHIDNRKDVAPVINKLLKSGHRKSYAEAIQTMKKEGLLELSEAKALSKLPHDDDLYQYQAAYRAYKKYGDHGIDGWDYCRALQVLGDCYQADYINLEECLDLSLPIAQELQKQFDNWEGVAESYLYGYQFWQKENADNPSESSFRWEVYQELTQRENGPYSVPYNTKLENTWANAKDKKARQEEIDNEEGYAPLIYNEQLSIKIKAPNGYEENEYSSEDRRDYYKEKSQGYGSIDVSYQLNENSEYSLESITQNLDSLIETIKSNPEYSDIVVSEQKERKINDITVSYVTYSYTFNTIKSRCYKSWAIIDNHKLLECKISETVGIDDELECSDDGTILDSFYTNLMY